ncbi:MAG: type II secretion system F family protein [Proteobacteria bacterium]|nr:type II secretion system F family protein [Pseudomonadota bacterium]MCL2307889.1 type II secretion system F family protein [Pseudomonadota bacterium]
MKSIKPSEWALFYKLLGNLLAAGYSPIESLSQLMQEPLSEKLKTQLPPLLATLPPTASLSDCLKLKVFTLDAATLDLFEKTTRIEEHINLLQAISARYSQASWINQLRGNSLYWPMLYFIVGGSTFVFILYYLLPLFSVMYENMGSSLQKEASFLLALRHGIVFLLFLLMAVFLALRFRPKPLHAWVDRLRLFRPWGALSEKIALTRFTHMLLLLLSKKVTPRHALILATTSIENVVIERRLQDAFTEAAASHTSDVSFSIADILKSCSLIPETFIAALNIAEKTQTLEETLPELTEMSADLLCRHTQTLNNRIDITSKVLVFVLIFWVALAVYLPLFSFGALI